LGLSQKKRIWSRRRRRRRRRRSSSPRKRRKKRRTRTRRIEMKTKMGTTTMGKRARKSCKLRRAGRRVGSVQPLCRARLMPLTPVERPSTPVLRPRSEATRRRKQTTLVRQRQRQRLATMISQRWCSRGSRCSLRSSSSKRRFWTGCRC
jgi:hypothetical protein